MKIDSFYTFNEYMKENKLTISEEDYLEMIYRLCLDKKYTRVNKLAQAINVKPPSVSKMLKKLTKKNLIQHVEYGIIQLTAQGKKIGKSLLERHLIIENFLKLLGIKDNLLQETEKIEHTANTETVLKINLLLDFFDNNAEIKTKLQTWMNDNR